MTNFAEVAELEKILDFDFDANQRGIAEFALTQLSEQARFYGRPWPDPATAPPMVRVTVLGAAQRHMTNYEGYINSRAGDETLGWTDRGEDAGSAYFTQREINTLRDLGGRHVGLTSIPIYTWSNRKARTEDIYIGTDAPNGADMPFVAADEAEWWGY